MPELTKKQKRLMEVARKGGNDSALPLLEAISELEDTIESLKNEIAKTDEAIKREPPEDVKVEKVAMRLAAKLALKPYPSDEELKEIITPLISEVEDILIGKLDESNSENLVSLKKEISAMMEKMMTEHKRGMEKMYQEHEEMMKEQRDGMEFIHDKVQTMKSGKDGEKADEEKIVEEVLKKLPKSKDFDFESLKTEIKDTLKNEIEKVKNVLSNIPRGKGMGRARVPITRFVDLTSQVDGVATTFTLEPDTVRVYGVLSTQFPQIWNTTDWSFSGRTLTLNFTLQSGQSLVVVTESLFYP